MTLQGWTVRPVVRGIAYTSLVKTSLKLPSICNTKFVGGINNWVNVSPPFIGIEIHNHGTIRVIFNQS